MRTLVWAIGAVVLVDAAIVAWFAVRELYGRRRVRREIRQLDALWRAPAVPQLRLVHSAARRSGVHEIAAGVTTLERPVLAARPRARQASFAAFAAAMTALLVVLAFDVSAPTAERRAAADGSGHVSWTFPPDAPRDDRSSGTDGNVPSPSSAAEHASPDASPPPSAADGRGSDGPAPERVAADPRSTHEIVLAWVSVPEADGYLIERWGTAADAASGWNEIGETEASITTFVDTELEPGTTYYYRVSALTEDGTAASDVVSATTLPGPPDAPAIVATTNGSTVKVEWNDVSNETGYRVERSDASGEWAVIGTVGQDVTVYVDGGLEKGATYGYRVVATNESGESPPSDVVTATVGSDEDPAIDPGSQTEEPAGGAASTDPLVAAPEDASSEDTVTTVDHVTADGSPTSDEPAASGEATSVEEPTTEEPATGSESVSTEGAETTAMDDPAITEASAGS